MFRKMYNKVDPITSITQKVEKGVQLFGAIKSAYDVAKVVAPYAVRMGLFVIWIMLLFLCPGIA